MLARQLATILPVMTLAEAIETAQLHRCRTERLSLATSGCHATGSPESVLLETIRPLDGFPIVAHLRGIRPGNHQAILASAAKRGIIRPARSAGAVLNP
jgi:hypothetical protein